MGWEVGIMRVEVGYAAIFWTCKELIGMICVQPVDKGSKSLGDFS